MKVLFFAPHSEIWVHAFPEALVAEALQQSGHEVIYVTCGEVLQDQCVAMSASGIDYRSSLAERKRVCKRCGAHKEILRRRIGLKGYDMSEMLPSEDLDRIEKILSGLNPDNYLQLEFDSVPVGRYALYELLLRHKKNDLNLSREEWREYQAAIRGVLKVVLAGRRILERERPDRVVTYNSLYAVNRVFCRLAEERGIPTYFLHAGGNLFRRLQTLMLGRDTTLRYLKNLVAEWPRFRARPCPPELVDEITAHFLVLFSGESVFGYSTAAGRVSLDVRSHYGLRPNQRLLVATMSSPDERFAAQTVDALPSDKDLLFPSQVEWIRALIRFVAARPDLFLLIRVHPREFPNKRESVKSPHAALLEKAFENLPQNSRVNWPADGIALYDLANHTDVFLNSWSSAGKEMALLGIPVVAYSSDLIFYPADLNYVGKTEEEFFWKIEQALADGWSIERSREVYRWLAVEYGYGLIDISDSYRQIEHASRTLTSRFMRKIRKSFDRYHVQRKDCSGRLGHLSERVIIEQILRLDASTPLDPRVERLSPQTGLEAEDKALRAALARIGVALFGEAIDENRGPLAQRLATVSAQQTVA